MSNEIVLKALDEHGQAMEGFRSEIKSEIGRVHDRINQVQSLAESSAGMGGKSVRSFLASANGIPEGGVQNMTTGEVFDAAGNVVKRAGNVDGVNPLVKGFVSSPQFTALADGANSTGRVQIEGVNLKALTNAGQGIAGSAEYSVQPQRADGLYNDPRRRLTLLDVLPGLPVKSSSFEYVKLSNYVNTAAFQTEEGQQKAEANFDMAPETANIATVAHWTRASLQVLDDAPALNQQLMSLLEYGVLSKLESELIGGTGGKGKIAGLLELGTEAPEPLTTSGALMGEAERIGHAVNELQSNGWNPGLIIMNPRDWFLISSARATDGQYILGSPRAPASMSLWSVPVVVTPSLARNVAIVLDPAQVAILDRQMPTLAASREDAQNFTTNMVTILAELRAGLAVFAPGAVLIVDLTPEGLPTP